MKISNHYTTSLVGATSLKEKDKKAEKSRQRTVAKPGDGLDLSGRSQEIAYARSLALAAPEVRAEVVDEIVGMIANGAYTVTGEDVAPKLINDHLMLWT